MFKSGRFEIELTEAAHEKLASAYLKFKNDCETQIAGKTNKMEIESLMSANLQLLKHDILSSSAASIPVFSVVEAPQHLGDLAARAK